MDALASEPLEWPAAAGSSELQSRVRMHMRQCIINHCAACAAHSGKVSLHQHIWQSVRARRKDTSFAASSLRCHSSTAVPSDMRACDPASDCLVAQALSTWLSSTFLNVQLKPGAAKHINCRAEACCLQIEQGRGWRVWA